MRGSSAVKQRWIRLAVAKATSTRAARPVGSSELSSMEGVLVHPSGRPLTRRRRRWIERARVTGMRLGRRLGGNSLQSVGSDPPRFAASHEEGRQKLRRMLGSRLKTPGPGGSATEEPSIAAPPGLRWVWCTWFPCNGLRQRLKLEVRRQAKLHLVGSFGVEQRKRGRGPNLATVGPSGQDEPVCSDAARQHDHTAGNRAVRRVLVR